MDEPDDELELAAVRERDAIANRRRHLRSWLLAAGGSAFVILLAVAVLVWERGPAVAPPTANPFRTTPAADPRAARARLGPVGEAQLAAVALPAGWRRGPVSYEPGGDAPTWTTTWTAPAGDALSSTDLTTALSAGWSPCNGPNAVDTVCWDRFPFFLLLTRATTCVAARPCPDLAVTMFTI